jgi:hypothetical protein
MAYAIITKFFGPTRWHRSRIRAHTAAGSATVLYDYGLTLEENHRQAALVLATRIGWHGYASAWKQGELPDGTGSVFVRSDE